MNHDGPWRSRFSATRNPRGNTSSRVGQWVEMLESRMLLAATLLRDINAQVGGPSDPSDFVSAGNNVFFTASDGVHGLELWKTDGTAEGTVMLKDIWRGAAGSRPHQKVAVGDMLYFVAADFSGQNVLWKTDGSTDGTVPVDTTAFNPSDLVAVDGTLYFTATDVMVGRELWKSDGTEAGTVWVKDITPGVNKDDDRGWVIPYGSTLSQLIDVNGTLCFVALDESGAETIWRSDGTEQGTVPVHPFDGGAVLSQLQQINGALYFICSRDSYGPTELFRSDLTEGGAVRVVAHPNVYGMSELTAVGSDLFFAGTDAEGDRELWKTDATAAGARLVKDIDPRVGGGGWVVSSIPSNLTEFRGALYFTAAGPQHGHELWRSDGTTNGTVMVRDVYEGLRDGARLALARSGNALFFAASNGLHGMELWRTDGTSDGTERVTDIAPGRASALPMEIAEVNGMLLFSADDGTHGRELWMLPTSFAALGADGTLHIEGTDAEDNISLIVRGSTLRVWRAGAVSRSFPLNDVRRIEIDAGDGDDTIDWTGISIPTYCFGGLGNDRMTGGLGDDTLSGGAGRDNLSGGGGDDFVSGGATNDELYGGPGADHLEGGDANDLLAGGAHDDRLYGDAGNDLLSGNAGKDIMYGGEGDDEVTGGAGWDLHAGQGGNDQIFARDGRDDEVDGGAGDDTLQTDNRLDVVVPNDEPSVTLAPDGTLTVMGTSVDDAIFIDDDESPAGFSVEVIVNDRRWGFRLDDVRRIEAFGGSGDDDINAVGSGLLPPTLIDGGDGNDRLAPGLGAHTAIGGHGINTIVNDTDNSVTLSIVGTTTRDLIRLAPAGAAGVDLDVTLNASVVRLATDQLRAIEIDADGGDDVVDWSAIDFAVSCVGQSGVDRMIGGSGDDTVNGGPGKDLMYGGDGDDQLTGGREWDLHAGQGGNDQLFARDGRDDEVDGGEGDDAAQVDDLLDRLHAVETLVP